MRYGQENLIKDIQEALSARGIEISSLRIILIMIGMAEAVYLLVKLIQYLDQRYNITAIKCMAVIILGHVITILVLDNNSISGFILGEFLTFSFFFVGHYFYDFLDTSWNRQGYERKRGYISIFGTIGFFIFYLFRFIY